MNRFLKSTLLFIICITASSGKLCSQTYNGHKLLANKDVNIQAIETDSEDNLFVAATTSGNLCLSDEATFSEKTLNMMTYNILGAKQNVFKLIKIAQVIKDAKADVVALQEINNDTFDWFATLAGETNMNAYFFPIKNKYGIGILSKEEAISVHQELIERLPDSNDKENRGVLIAEFSNYYFISTHYALDANDRDRATEYIINFAKKANKKIFVAGDFNAQITYRAMQTFLASGFTVLNDTEIRTFNSTEPSVCIDMILTYTPNNVTTSYITSETGIANSQGVTLSELSDHLPVYVKGKIIENVPTNPNIEITPNENGNIAVVVKYDANNSLIWYKQIRGKGLSKITDMQVDKQGKVYVAGIVDGELSETSDIKGSVHGAFYACFKPNGELIWNYFLGNRCESEDYATICIEDDGTYYLGGNTTGNIDFGNDISLSFSGEGSFIVKYQPDGTCLWAQKIEPGEGKKAFINKIRLDKNKNPFVWFTSNSLNINVSNKNFNDNTYTAIGAYVAKLNELGQTVWMKKFKGMGSKTSPSSQRNVSNGPGAAPIPAAVNAEGNLFFFLWTSGTHIEVLDELGRSEILNNVSLGESLDYAGLIWLKYNTNGELIARHSFGNNEVVRTSTTNYLMNPSLVTDNKGNCYVGGYTSSASFRYTNDYAPEGWGKRDFFIAQINNNNEISYICRAGGKNDDTLPAMTLSNDNKTIFLGIQTNSCPMYLGLNKTSNIEQQGIKIEKGLHLSNIFISNYKIDTNMGIIEHTLNEIPLKFYFSNGTIKFYETKHEYAYLSIYSISGTVLFKGNITEGLIVNCPVKSPYIIHVKTNDGIYVQKIM